MFLLSVGSHSWCHVFLYVWLSLNMTSSSFFWACPEGTHHGHNLSTIPQCSAWSSSPALVALSHIQGEASAICRAVWSHLIFAFSESCLPQVIASSSDNQCHSCLLCQNTKWCSEGPSESVSSEVLRKLQPHSYPCNNDTCMWQWRWWVPKLLGPVFNILSKTTPSIFTCSSSGYIPRGQFWSQGSE